MKQDSPIPQSLVRHTTHCQFCKLPLTVSVDAEYASLGDPYKLIARACCNLCCDLRVERRGLEYRIGKACRALEFAGDSAEVREKIRKVLNITLKQYSNLIARWHRMDGGLWEDAIVDLVMHRPHQWGSIVSKMWATFSQWKKQQQPTMI